MGAVSRHRGYEFEHTYRTAVASGTAQTLQAYYPAPLDKWLEILAWPDSDGLSLYFSDITERVTLARRAERDGQRLALQAEVTDLLVADPDMTTVLQRLPALLTPALADACVVTVLGPDGRAEDVSSWHADPVQRPHLAGYAGNRLMGLTGETPFAQALQHGEVRPVSTAQTAAVLMHPTAREHLDRLGPVEGMIVPLRAGGRVLGALTLLSAPGRGDYLDVRSTAVDIADRVGAALQTAHLTRARGQLVEDLQRSLLTEPPQPDHGEIAVRYLPAGQANRVGGDWYDAFIQRGGTTMLVIGDVAGHDTAAAATMAQLRGLLRGIATYSDARPAEVLRGLDEAMEVLEVGTLVTAAVVRFEQTPDEVERGVTRMVWANAGHPPPVVINPDGSFAVLADWKGDLLLGVSPQTARVDQTITLDRDSIVLLYTDGLIERRDTDLDHGLTQLTTAITELHGSTLTGLIDGVLDRLLGGTPDDDVAIVAIRLHPQDQPRPVEAGPQHIPPGVPEPPHLAH